MSAKPKLATPGLLKITVFEKKSYALIIFLKDIIKKVLLPDSNYIEDVVMWPKFDNSSSRERSSMREVIISSIL